MFFCEKCRVENDWPTSLGGYPTSFGHCEMCKAGRQSCYDIPSSCLPDRVPPTTSRKSNKARRQERDYISRVRSRG